MFCTSEDSISTILKEPPSPFGRLLFTVKVVSLCLYRFLATRTARTYARVVHSRIRLVSLGLTVCALTFSVIEWVHSAPVSFADGEQEKISFILGNYISPDTHQLNTHLGLSQVAVSGENIGGITTSADDVTQPQPGTHVVASGETLGGIAAEYKMASIDFLVANPNIKSINSIYPGQILTVPSAPATVDQIAALKKTTQTSSDDGSVAYPLRPRYISQYFGGNKEAYGPKGHTGVDMVTNIGTPVHAATDGTVTFAETGWNGGYGTDIIIKEQNSKISTLYGHLSKLLVHEGEVVSVGDEIALSGDTGNSTGPHLHFEVRIDGEPVNPMVYLP